MPKTHRLTPGSPVRIGELSTKGKDFCDDKESAVKKFFALRKELIDLQFRFYAERRRKLLIVLQAPDAGGKDGTIRRVFSGVNPQGVRVTPFKVPTEEERDHDFLWRIHKAVPRAGMIGIFNRSHYEDVLVTRVDRLISEKTCERRYAQINEFEQFLTETGTTILKFFLHISSQQQKKRLEARLNDPNRNWKFDVGDLEKRKKWDDYQAAYERMLNACTSAAAPWYVIPADQKWYRNLAIVRVIVEVLREMDPQFPKVHIE